MVTIVVSGGTLTLISSIAGATLKSRKKKKKERRVAYKSLSVYFGQHRTSGLMIRDVDSLAKTPSDPNTS